MDMRRLEVLCKVVELKSFTKAADALGLSQPTVSEHIKSLEDMLGARMVDRLGRVVMPTPSGRVFYGYAKEILTLREKALQALVRFRDEPAGRLVIGASTIPGTYLLPRLIGTFKADHPLVDISLTIGDSSRIVAELLEDSIEAGVIGTFQKDQRLELRELFDDELVLVVAPGHPWLRRGKIDPEDLIGEPFIIREKGSGTRSVMLQRLEPHGISVTDLAIVAEMGSTEAVRHGVKARIGVSILSQQAVAEDLEHGLLGRVEIRGVDFSRPLYSVTRKGRETSPVCAAFMEHMETDRAKNTTR